MGRLMACNDETDGGRDKRDMHVRGHYSSAAHTQRLKTQPKGCRRSRLPPTSLFLSPSSSFFFHLSLSPSCSSHSPSVAVFCFSPLRLLSVSSRDLSHSYQITNLFYFSCFRWETNGRIRTNKLINQRKKECACLKLVAVCMCGFSFTTMQPWEV